MKRNMLAWNFSYPTLELFGQLSTRSVSDPSFSLSTLSGSDVSANPGFDFFAMPMPQAGSSKIVFTSNRDGNAEIYSMNADGSNLTRLTVNSFNDDHPRWSLDGTKILFQSDRDNPETGNADVYVMNANGTSQTRLTYDAADDSVAVWSPDSTKIVFQSFRNGQYYQVYVMNADGTNQVNTSGGFAADCQPSWSPDGAKIAFASERDHAGRPSVYVMNANGSNQTRLTVSSDPFRDEQPAWSRDATKIAFVSTRDSVIETWQETDDDGAILNRSRVRTNKEVYKMNADGSNQIRLTNTFENDDSPYWSPDGTQIIFRSDRERDTYDPTQQLWTMSADGTNQAIISSNEFGDYSPSWNTSAANQSPISIPGGPYSGVVAQNVPFDGSASFDSEGSIVSYAWNFGDGSSGSGAAPTHTYISTGTYTVTLTVTDNQGAQATANTSVTITAAGSEQYMANFNLSALARQPSPEESAYWNDILRAAYANGQNSKLLAVRELGKTLFESADYAARNRNNHWYVYDLYKSYLTRDPDAPGWAFWENELNKPNPLNREQLRRAFDECGEFAGIVATLTPSGSPSSSVSSLGSARVDPFNQPGNGLASRDAEWSVSLLSLPGRAGLDLGLSLSYSSMVWTRSGPYIYFDEDNGSLSPGFRLGFPTIQEKFFDAQAGDNVYLLIAGSRVSLRQVGTSNVYEAADSSYLQLIDNGGSLLVRSTDGTQLSYQPFNDEWRCTQIKDRNGNYITVNYDWLGHITTITDTLARTITFNYDTNANLTSITQSWTVNGVPTTHTWATFGWATKTLSPSFSNVVVVGAPNGSIPVLSQVGLDDGSRHTFEYNSTGQVNPIRSYGSDNVERTYTAYDYDSPAADCPRLSETHVWAQNWTGINGVPQEVATVYGDPGDGLHTVTAPDGTLYKEFYGTGWQRGLPIQTEVWSAGVKQKWTSNNWTQDNTGVNYQTNPRVTESNVYDSGGNHRRTTIDYQIFTLPGGASCNLPSDTREYAGSAGTALRHAHTDYRMDPVADAPYLNLHVLGLVKEQSLFEVNTSSETLMSKVGFQYDETGSIQGTDAPFGHDNSYDGNFVTGRGNLSSVKRYDANDTSQFTLSTAKYNTAGAVVATKDPLNHEVTVSYADSFSANGTNLDAPRSFTTLAFPTTIADADGFSSNVRYHYDLGAKTRLEGPPPDNQPQGAIQIFAYDGAGRIDRVTTGNNGAYRRFVYGPNYVETRATVNNVADEAYSNTVFDGAGRAIAAARNHPGSDGGYSAVITVYDRMGRAIRQSNPTETTANGTTWPATGDDAYNAQTGEGDWRYTQQTYDWQGRPLITTNTDGTTKEASYSGCGCAGGEVVVTRDELGRRQKIISDILGRLRSTQILYEQPKSEVLNGDGTIYSTTVNNHNARNQVTLARQYAGPEGSATFQETTMSYDGYGRPKTRHAPEQDAGTSTTWVYNADDQIQKITDARGSIANFNYNNNRHLVTSISYDPVSGVTDTPDASFAYDAAGNRTSMTDGSGSTTYQVNQLSQLASETRQITGLTGSYTLSYEYNLAGQLKKITEPAGSYVDYSYDTAGRMESVSGAGLGTSQYASSLQYRAWGGLKSLAYGNTTSLSVNYNQRGQVTHYGVGGVKAPVTGAIQPEGGDFQYYADGQVKFASDLRTGATAYGLHDRAYSYDHAARLKEAYSGTEARDFVNGTSSGVFDGAFRQTYGYDPFGNLTTRTGRFWSEPDNASDSYNSHNRNPAWEYDADGRLMSRNEPSPNGLAYQSLRFSYDAAGRRTQSTQTTSRPSPNPNSTVIFTTVTTRVETYDGDGVGVKSATTTQTNGGAATTKSTFYLRSSILGGRTIAEYDSAGVRQKTSVFAGGEVLAEQVRLLDGTTSLLWEHNNPVTGDGLNTDTQGVALARTTLDPMAVDLGDSDPFVSEGGNEGGSDAMDRSIDAKVAQLIPGFGGPQVKLDGFITSPHLAFSAMASGAAMFASSQTVYGIYSRSQGRYVGLAIWNQSAAHDGVILFGSGSTGYIPVGTSYREGLGLSGSNVTQWLANYGPLGQGPHQDFISTKTLQIAAMTVGSQISVPLKDTDELRNLMQKALNYQRDSNSRKM